MQVVCHDHPGIDSQIFLIDTIVQRLYNDVFIISSAKQVDPLDNCQCEKVITLLILNFISVTRHSIEYSIINIYFIRLVVRYARTLSHILVFKVAIQYRYFAGFGLTKLAGGLFTALQLLVSCSLVANDGEFLFTLILLLVANAVIRQCLVTIFDLV